MARPKDKPGPRLDLDPDVAGAAGRYAAQPTGANLQALRSALEQHDAAARRAAQERSERARAQISRAIGRDLEAD